MLFNSFQYFVFFLVSILFYYFLKKQKYRVWLLLVASSLFYMYFVPKFIFILFLVITIDYTTSIAISKQIEKNKKRFFLLLSIISNLLILFVFKYYNFFIENVEHIIGNSRYRLDIILPIGLSFHTFQSLSYVIEVYRGNYKAEKRIDVFALYVLFFPQLVAGPIERPQNIIYQLKEFKTFNYDDLLKGIKLISIGLIKKCVIADRLCIYIDNMYTDVNHSSSISVLVGIIFFSIQIYFDFSGYSDIAVGSAKCLGIDLMKNFNLPYLSKSLKEFWTRWHISLSTWFKDYVFIPLGGSRVSKSIYFRNIMIVFSLSGLWHGASWNFIIWGILHGMIVFLSSVFSWSFSKFYLKLRVLDVVFNFSIVTLLWVFFRSPDFKTTQLIFNKLFNFSLEGVNEVFQKAQFGLFSLIVVLLAFLYLKYLKSNMCFKIMGKAFPVTELTISFCLIFIFGVFNNQSFIYFQF